MAKRKKQLATYRAKRDFSKTPEPSGDLKVAASKRLRFVVQKHAATRLHYDLRLEMDGVFKSWAVTKPPSFDPATKRLAVEVEDHPLEYGDFEGTIAPEQYGAGTVQLWDRGFWQPDGALPAQAMLAKGELKFQLEGERLQGGWVLVRMRNDKYRSKRNNWLFIKHRDAFARRGDDAVIEEDSSVASRRSMAEIAAGKGRRPRPFMLAKQQSFAADAQWESKRGASKAARSPPRKATRRGTRLAKMPEFVPPQLCTLLERPPGGAGWAHEIKFDGYRIQMRIESGACVLRTRKGLDWSDRFPEIAAAGKRLPDCLIDGEVVALDRAGAPDFAGLQAALSESSTAQLVYFAFDLLCSRGEDLRKLPLADRKESLRALLKRREKGRSSIRYVEHFDTGGDALLRSACRMSLEGIVSKKLDAPYHSGRGHAWTKAKCRAGHEVIIGGWSETGGRFRSLLVGVRHDERTRHDELVYVGRVGTGFGAQALSQILPRLKQQSSDLNPFKGSNAPKDKSDNHWVKPVLVAEIEFAGWTEDGMVRQGSFKGLREDKPAAEVHAEWPSDAQSTPLAEPAQAQAPAQARTQARGALRRRSGSAPASNFVVGLAISNPDKTMWPASGAEPALTKLDLARYFEVVGPRMIEYVRARPISLVRAPDGIDGQHFFQRHAMMGMSSLIGTVRVSGDRKPHLQIERTEALVALAQIAALELHPWNCEPGAPDTPGRLVFDLDPATDLPFDTVVEAAVELRTRLEELGLVAFCKTTGGKGLHLVTPLKSANRDAIGWAEAKLIARTICEQMAADSPKKYLTTMAKKERTGRIFLDYLRNDRMATAVGLLSPRARAGAPVSMPLPWSKVTKRLKPTDFTVRTVPRMLARSDPWSDYRASARPLVMALKKLVATTRAA